MADKFSSAIAFNFSQNCFHSESGWLEFNYRVLHEALNERHSLLERLKYTAILSSNIDEFLMIHMAQLRKQVAVKANRTANENTCQQLEAFKRCLKILVKKQHRNFMHNLRPQLDRVGIDLVNYKKLNREQRIYCQSYFEERVFPLLTPLGLDARHPFPHISNLSLNIAVILKDDRTGIRHFGCLKLPKTLPRLIEILPRLNYCHNKNIIWHGIPLEQIVFHNLPTIFPGMEIQEYGLFRVTRNADYFAKAIDNNDLSLTVEPKVKQPHFDDFAVRLEINSASTSIRQTLSQQLNLQSEDVYELQDLINLGDLIFLTTIFSERQIKQK